MRGAHVLTIFAMTASALRTPTLRLCGRRQQIRAWTATGTVAQLSSHCSAWKHVPRQFSIHYVRKNVPATLQNTWDPQLYWKRGFSHHVPWNKYARFRRRLSAQENGSNDDNLAANDIDHRQVAQEAFSVLARRGRTWRRLGHIVELSCGDLDHGVDDIPMDRRECSSANDEERSNLKSVADIGCDHGLLAIALAASGRYESVIGVDVSSKALENGAIAFHKKILDVLSRESPSLDNVTEDILAVEFRVGDGLAPLEKGEADAVAISGMGVNTMIKILFKGFEKGQAEIDRVGCKNLFLQPTNSRPRNLTKLYELLQNSGWVVKEERIEYLSSRWYITIAFSKSREKMQDSDAFQLPGDKLMTMPIDSLMYKEHMDYVKHHQTWLERDLRLNGSLREGDLQWYEARKSQ